VFFFNLPEPSSRAMALESTQPLTEMSTRNLPGGGGGTGGWRVRLTTLPPCEPIVQRRFTTLWAFMACYRDSFTFNLYADDRTPWTGDQPVTRPLPTHRTTQTQNKRTQTFMPLLGFEPTIPVFERTKMVNALDRAATVIGT
jgi:hypothetical protein